MANRTTRPRSRTRSGEIPSRARKRIPSALYAFPKQRKEPLTDKRHVQNALARFDQVEGVSDSERQQAFRRIKKAAARFGLDVQEKSWRSLGKRPHTSNPGHNPKS